MVDSMPTMTWAPEARDGIRRTISQYCQLCDDGRFDEWIHLFTADARFHVMGRTQVGREAILEWMAKAQGPEARGRNLAGDPIIELDPDGHSARAWTDYVFLDRHHQVISVGRYHDELMLGHDGRWRFDRREVVIQGASPELTQPPPG